MPRPVESSLAEAPALARAHPPAQSGFTLLELMTVMVLIGIGLSIAVPTLTDMLRNERLSATTDEFVKNLQIAKSEAMQRNAQVSICNTTTPNATAATATCVSSSTSPSWKTGWLMFVENKTPRTGIYDNSSTDVMLRAGALNKVDTATDTSANPFIVFRSSIMGGATDRTIKFCTTKALERQVTITKSGRISVTLGSTCP